MLICILHSRMKTFLPSTFQQAAAMNQEASNLKAKIRRLEEDNLKKEKEIDGLLNPQKVSFSSQVSI